MALAPDQPADEQEARPGRVGRARSRGPSGSKALADRRRWGSSRRGARRGRRRGTCGARTRSAPTARRRSSRIGATQSRGTAPNSHGWMTRQPPARGRAQIGRPLVADLDVGRVRQRRVARGGAPSRATRCTGPGSRVADLAVDDRQADRRAVVALPAHGRRRRSASRLARDGPLARVVGLELVDVGGEGPRRRDRRLEPLEQPGLGGEPVELTREVVGVEAVEDEPVDLVADRLGQPAESRHDQRHARGEALGGRERRAVPPQRRQRGDVDARAAARPISLGANAPHSSTTPRRSSALSCAANCARDLAVDAARAGARCVRCAASHEQLRALVRVGRAEEADGQLLADAARARGRGPTCSQISCSMRHRLADDVDQVGRVALGERACRAPRRTRPGTRSGARVGARADLAQPPPVAVDVVAADAGGAVAAAIAGPGADRALPGRAGRRAGRSSQ